MSWGLDKNNFSPGFYGLINPLLVVLVIFNVLLTLYCCTQYYAYLPTSDTIVHMDFLSRAARGELALELLFEKHNQVHQIALPKFAYFLDMWLTRGSGTVVVAASLLAQIGALLLFLKIINQSRLFLPQEKTCFSLLSVLFLLSACQSQSLLNPANIQWSLLTFFATLCAYLLNQYERLPKQKYAVAMVLAVAGVAFSSASAWLILIPLLVMLLMLRYGKKRVFRLGWFLSIGLLLLLALVETTGTLFIDDYKPAIVSLYTLLTGSQTDGLINIEISGLYLLLLDNFIKFVVDFLLPVIERFRQPFLSLVAAFFLVLFTVLVYRNKPEHKEINAAFFELLMLFVLFIAIVIGLVRSYTGLAFTYRFVNLGLLFSLCASIYLLFMLRKADWRRRLAQCCVAVYACFLSYINVTESSDFAFGRNHIRLTQVAYSLEMEEPYVVVSMPGTVWQETEYDFLQENLPLLKKEKAGIYSDRAYQWVGQPLSVAMEGRELVECESEVIKMRRLSARQAGYKVIGSSKQKTGKERFSRALFIDSEGVIRGYAIPVMSDRNILKNLYTGNHWTGFVNLDLSAKQFQIDVHAYDTSTMCQGKKINLPPYKAFVKKKKVAI